MKVITEIAEAVEKATPNPEIYPADKYKINNDGSYRVFEKPHYPIAFRFNEPFASCASAIQARNPKTINRPG